MKPIRSEEIDALMTDIRPPAVSLYLPTEHAGPPTRKNAIRFGNLLREATDRLADLDPEARGALLAPLEAMRDENAFWQHQARGLAVFRDRERTAFFSLPVEVESAVHVGPRFAIRPLLPLVHFDGRFHIVEFGQETVKLYAGTRYELRPVLLPEETPTGLTDVVGAELDGPHLQQHSGNGPGRRTLFHGHGAGASKEDGEMRKYAAHVARTLPRAMDPEAPVVLAGTESAIGLFRKVAGWSNLCERWINGAPGRFDRDGLHEKGWAIAGPVIRRRRMRHLDDIEGLESHGRATHTLDDALEAARAGRVEALYLTGRAPNDADFEELARHTWRNGGRIFEVEAPDLPGERTFAAVLRY